MPKTRVYPLDYFHLYQENFNKILVEDNEQWTPQSPRNSLLQYVQQNKTGQPQLNIYFLKQDMVLFG